MLGRAARTINEAYDMFAKSGPADVIADIKYDGERTQVHFSNGQVNLFSRNFESQNEKFWMLREKLQEWFEQ